MQVTEGPAAAHAETGSIPNKERLRKPLVFSFMGLACALCLYLIFGRNLGTTAKEEIKVGINDAVPQASGDGLPTDKGKAYEQEMLRVKEQQKKDAMMSLSEYWQSDSTGTEKDVLATAKRQEDPVAARPGNPALNSYRNMQSSLNAFYQPNAGQDALRKENEALKQQLEARETEKPSPAQDRLALMEQSYKMAAKYFPGTVATSDSVAQKPLAKPKEDEGFVSVAPGRKSVVSQLHRRVPDSLLLAHMAAGEFNTFSTAASTVSTALPANSIRACIHQGGKITAEGSVQLRLLQDARIGQAVLPRGFLLTATAKFQSSRLQLQVVSVEVDGSILPVNLTVYDLDGQQGLSMPFSAEVSAVNATLGNMGNTSGSSFTINRSAEQQVVADMSRGVIQGVSGYFSKKVKTQKVTLKAGHQVFLVSKKK